jgi:hypothetical protein
MIEDVDGVLLTDGQSRIFLHPPEPYPDGHGYHHQVELVGGPFRGTIDASSYQGPGALRSFHQQLVALYQSLRGEAQLPQSYENLKVLLKGDGLGHISVLVTALAGDCMDVRLTLAFRVDQTRLPPIIAAVERFFLKSSSHPER